MTVTLIGLAIHCLADGIALGASQYLSKFSETNSQLGLVVFIAILMHKAPAAIGFGTFLKHEGLTAKEAAQSIAIFTLAAPLSALLTFYAMQGMAAQSSDIVQLQFWVGIALLVSGGTFIYVATIHILPEVYCNTDIHRPHDHKHLPEDHVHDQEHYSKPVELTAMVLGMALPTFIATYM